MGGTKEPTPSKEEIEKVITSLKNETVAGPEETPSELLKLRRDSVMTVMHKITTIVWQTGKWPEEWTQSTFVPINQQGDPTICANYHTISLISHASKVLLFQTKYTEYWRSAISESRHDVRALWSKVNNLPSPPAKKSTSLFGLTFAQSQFRTERKDSAKD